MVHFWNYPGSDHLSFGLYIIFFQALPTNLSIVLMKMISAYRYQTPVYQINKHSFNDYFQPSGKQSQDDLIYGYM